MRKNAEWEEKGIIVSTVHDFFYNMQHVDITEFTYFILFQLCFFFLRVKMQPKYFAFLLKQLHNSLKMKGEGYHNNVLFE